MSSINNQAKPRFKQCATRGCREEGNSQLRINYICKTGLFCDKCAAELLKEDLAVRAEPKTENEDAESVSKGNHGMIGKVPDEID